MSSSRPPAFVAADVFWRWKSLIASAETSVVIYSPFLDQLVRTLISNSRLMPSGVTVITDLSPRSGALDYLAQLRTLKRLIDDGVQVRSLPRLHAKVLLVDGERLALGSQNFTRYARRSRETTAVPLEVISEREFLRELDAWHRDSMLVTTEFIADLIARLMSLARDARRATEALGVAFDGLLDQFAEAERTRMAEQEAERRRRAAHDAAAAHRKAAERFDALTRRSTVRLAQGTAWASVKTVGSWRSGWFSSLVADRGYDLTKWVGGVDAAGLPKELVRLKMYPIMLLDSGRMGFARVGKERVSYVRQGVAWTRTMTIAGRPTNVVTRFPDSGLDRANVTLEFTQDAWPTNLTCTIEALFDGDQFRVLPPSPSGMRTKFESDVRAHFAQLDNLSAFVQEYFEAFKFSDLEVSNHNARDFFTGSRYKLSLFEFESTPFFIASHVH